MWSYNKHLKLWNDIYWESETWNILKKLLKPLRNQLQKNWEESYSIPHVPKLISAQRLSVPGRIKILSFKVILVVYRLKE